MNTVEKLLRADKGLLDKKETGEIHCARISRLMGEDFTVKIQELNGRRIREIAEMSKTNYDADLLYCVEGVTDPPLKDKRLMEYYNAATPKDLAEKMFGFEAGKTAAAIVELSTSPSKGEKEVKN
jgi:hypothetical protein